MTVRGLDVRRTTEGEQVQVQRKQTRAVQTRESSLMLRNYHSAVQLAAVMAYKLLR